MAGSRDTGRGPGTTGIALAAAAATVVAVVPHLLRTAGDYESDPLVLTITWLVLLGLAGPLTAGVLSARHPVVTTASQALLVGSPQIVVTLVLMRLDTWLEVRRGYLMAGSGEEAMAYGIGGLLSVILGLVLIALVAVAARLGTVVARRRGGRAPSSTVPRPSPTAP